jgi:hypothetical protein
LGFSLHAGAKRREPMIDAINRFFDAVETITKRLPILHRLIVDVGALALLAYGVKKLLL